MGTVLIQPETTKNPITLIGRQAGICWGADTTDELKNFKRGLDCLEAWHGRTFEFPDVYLVLDGYSARVIREWYTHIGGSPTRLQASTRYIDYQNFPYVIPQSIENNEETLRIYQWGIGAIRTAIEQLTQHGVPREDAALLLPLGMQTKIVCKHNLRNLIDMSHQRMCSRAYWEYRNLFNDVKNALHDYSQEWAWITDQYFQLHIIIPFICHCLYSFLVFFRSRAFPGMCRSARTSAGNIDR